MTGKPLPINKHLYFFNSISTSELHKTQNFVNGPRGCEEFVSTFEKSKDIQMIMGHHTS